MSYNFKFGEYWITELGAVSTGTPDIEIAQRDGTMINIPGKDGDDYIDSGRYKNVEISRSISALSKKGISLKDKVANIIDEYAYLQGYQDFEDTDHPGMVTQAVLRNFGEFNRQFRTLHSAQLKFSRKPYWILKSAMDFKSVDMTATTPEITFNNPFPARSKPIIYIVLASLAPGTSVNYSITTEGVTTSYSVTASATSTVNGIVIDSEKKSITIGTGANKSNLPGSIPEGFGVGSSVFRLTSNKASVSSIEISPRWRCL